MSVGQHHHPFSASLGISTVNATGETLVLNKDFPSIKQGFYQHNGGKVGKIVIFPALSKYFPSIKMGKSLFSTRVSPVTFTV